MLAMGLGRLEGVRVDTGGTVAAEEFGELLRGSAQAAFGVGLAMLRDRSAAEDCVQDAALKAWRRRTSLRSHDAFRPWFLAIVANECRSLRRGRWFRALRVPLHADLPALSSSHDEAERRLDLARALAQLGEEDRLAVYLYYYLDLPVAQAADAMSCSLSAFRSRLTRAVRRLRPGLEPDETDFV